MPLFELHQPSQTDRLREETFKTSVYIFIDRLITIGSTYTTQLNNASVEPPRQFSQTYIINEVHYTWVCLNMFSMLNEHNQKLKYRLCSTWLS